MQFVAYLKVGSFSARMGRAKNLTRVVLEGVSFYWEGHLHRYQSDILEDPGKLLGHPSVDLAAMGIPPEPQGTGPELWKANPFTPDRGSGIPRKKKGKLSPEESPPTAA